MTTTRKNNEARICKNCKFFSDPLTERKDLAFFCNFTPETVRRYAYDTVCGNYDCRYDDSKKYTDGDFDDHQNFILSLFEEVNYWSFIDRQRMHEDMCDLRRACDEGRAKLYVKYNIE